MRFTEYGRSTGKPVVYFHGVPGSPREAAVLDTHAQANNLRVLCFERFAADETDYNKQLALAIKAEIGEGAVDFIGFSIGTQVALQTASFLPGQVRAIHLVSAVAPLNQGDFLNTMAGKAVFTLAQKQPWVFKLLARWQAFLAPRFPNALFGMLFASAQGQDNILASQPEFKRFISTVLVDCFSKGADGYCRDIQNFVRPWALPQLLPETRVHLWHGSDDNWSPIGMAEYLNAALPGATEIHRGVGLSHYSCLYDAAPKICAQLAIE